MTENKLISKCYDDRLTDIEGLSWLPWVGRRYDNSKLKLLIVGESHYVSSSEEKNKILKNIDTSRWIIEESVIDREWGAKTYDNLHRTLFGIPNIHEIYDNYNVNRLWEELSFYNFIQIPMEYNDALRERPSYKSWCEGWYAFYEAVKILQPKVCLFVGVTAANSFESVKDKCGFQGEIRKSQTISNCQARIGNLRTDKIASRLLFIRHSGGAYSWGKWHAYLQDVIPEELKYIQEIGSK